MKAFEAVKLFNELRDDPQLHNEKPQTGCFIRAEKIAEKLSEKGLTPYIVITDGKNNQNLNGRLAYRELGRAETAMDSPNWGFHVAAAARVKDLNGKEDLLVFDTALFDGPATLDNWARTMFKEGKPLCEADIKLLDYGLEGKHLLQKIKKQAGISDAEDFFAGQPDKYAGKELIKWPSTWLKKYHKVQSVSKNSIQK